MKRISIFVSLLLFLPTSIAFAAELNCIQKLKILKIIADEECRVFGISASNGHGSTYKTASCYAASENVLRAAKYCLSQYHESLS